MNIETVDYHSVSDRFLAQFEDCCWGLPDQEHFHCTSMDDALEELIDEELPPDRKSVTLCAMRHKTIPSHEPSANHILNYALEDLDSEYGPPDETNDPTPRMIQAAYDFAEVIRREFKVWACKPVLYVTVDLERWRTEHGY